MKFISARRAALAVFVSLALASTAHAQDATAFATKLGAAYSAVGYDLKFGAATTSGSTITYDGLDVTIPGTGAPALSYKLDSKLTFAGVKAGADGSYTADSLTLPDMNFKIEEADVSIKNIVFNHIYLPATKTPGVVDMAELIGDATVGPITVTVNGAKAVTVDQVTLKNAFTPAQGDKALSDIVANAAATGITIDMSAAKDPDSVAQAKALGLTTITGKGVENFSWSFKDGHMDASEISVALDNVGKVKFAFDLTGYTPALLDTLMSAEKSMAQSGGAASTDDSGKQMALLLGTFQTLFLNSASLRYDDASITNKLLDYTAKQQNVTKDALIDQIVGGAGGAMSQGTSGGAPDQMTLLSQAALRAFLSNPQSIEVKLAPKTPLGILGIVGAAMAPDSLVDQIGLQVLVNDKQITPADAAAEGKRDADAAASAPAAPADDSSTAPSDDTTTAPADNSAGASDDSAAPASDGSTDKLSVQHSN